ncbi:MAG: SRPBCC family protein [Halioglobus sp.]|nr:SRPBCC family protein [Halioglobus sp.]
MAIEFQETFRVSAPIDTAWQFMLTPENIIACMPGASLAEIVDETRFVGNVKLKVGAVTASYQGTITYTDMNREDYSVVMLAEGKEKGGGTVSGTIKAKLQSLPEGGTEVDVASSIDLTGRIMQVGRGMIQGVSQQIIKKFVANAQARLDQPAPGSPASEVAGTSAAPPPALETEDSINVVAVVFRVIWDAIRNFFKRIFGKK